MNEQLLKLQIEAGHEASRQDCRKALVALAGIGYPTPAEGYGTNSSWAISDLCRAVKERATPVHMPPEERVKVSDGESLPSPTVLLWEKLTQSHLPEDDSEVFIAVLWRNQEKTTKEYRVAHCTYREGGFQLFTDCEGEVYTPEEVSYWIYARALLDLLPAIETIGNTPAKASTEPSGGGVRDPEPGEPRQQGTSK